MDKDAVQTGRGVEHLPARLGELRGVGGSPDRGRHDVVAGPGLPGVDQARAPEAVSAQGVAAALRGSKHVPAFYRMFVPATPGLPQI